MKFEDSLTSKFASYYKNTEATDEFCERHNRQKRYMQTLDRIICPLCETEKFSLEAERKASEQFKREFDRKADYFLNKYSSLNEEVRKATFDNFKVSTPAEREKLEFAKRIAKEYLDGKKNNVVLIGKTGTGKSHLAHAILFELLEKTNEIVIFASTSSIDARINFDNWDSEVERLVEAKFLVIDDLGAEMNSPLIKQAIQKIFESRTKIIVTTNLQGEEIVDRYGKRIYSRLMTGVDENHFMKFDDITDKRRLLF